MGRTKQLLLAIIPTAAFMLGTVDASAQAGAIAPDGQLGIGVNTGGATIQYAFSPSFHLGAQVSLVSQSTEDVSSNMTIGFGPYGRLLLEGPINPFVQVGLEIASTSTNPEGTGEDVSTSTMSLYAALGIEYFATRNVGIYGAIGLLDIELSNSSSQGDVTVDNKKTSAFGIGGGRLGIEYFFAR